MRRMPAAALLALLVAPALAQPAPPRVPTVSVVGTGEVEMKPDLARILASVVTQADTAAQAGDFNKQASDRVLARLQALGVRREDVRTVSVQVAPTPPRVKPDGSEAKGPRFTATQQLQVTTRDIDGVGRLAGEILGSGDMTLQAVAFGRDDDREAEDAARREAVKDARRQAEVLSQAAGVALGRLLEIRNASAQPVAFEDRSLFKGALRQAPELSVVPPATIRTSATVEMMWELAPGP